MKAAARQVAGFVGEHGSNRHPILIVIGAQSPPAIVEFQNAVLHTLDVCDRIRNFDGLPRLRSYLDRSSVRDPVYYAEAEAPSLETQSEIVRLFSDEKKRHFMPLLLTAVRRHPHEYAHRRAAKPVLLPKFLSLVGDRVVDITPEAAAGHIPIWERMSRLFQAVVTRDSELEVEPAAAQLIGEVMRSDTANSDEMVVRLASRAKTQAKERKLPTVTRELVWELLPPPLRDALHLQDTAVS